MLVSGTDTSFAPSAILPESYNNGRTRGKKKRILLLEYCDKISTHMYKYQIGNT